MSKQATNALATMIVAAIKSANPSLDDERLDAIVDVIDPIACEVEDEFVEAANESAADAVDIEDLADEVEGRLSNSFVSHDDADSIREDFEDKLDEIKDELDRDFRTLSADVERIKLPTTFWGRMRWLITGKV